MPELGLGDMSGEIKLLARAWHVATERHVDHRRKGERAEPYVNHLAEVADLVAEATDGSDPNLVAAAVLHDTIEDTGMTYTELESRCCWLTATSLKLRRRRSSTATARDAPGARR